MIIMILILLSYFLFILFLLVQQLFDILILNLNEYSYTGHFSDTTVTCTENTLQIVQNVHLKFKSLIISYQHTHT